MGISIINESRKIDRQWNEYLANSDATENL
jgi:hypothetical protein